VYAFDEHFFLPLSHDEVVHGKGSLIGKMPGDEWQKHANLRLYYAFMYAHPGKKLLFMGQEFGQIREWNHDLQLDWYLLENPRHAGLQRLVSDLNNRYRSEPALHELDCASEGFQWVEHMDADQGVISFIRYAANRSDHVALYGGSNVGNQGVVVTEPRPMHGQPASLCLTLPPLATLYLCPDE
jgi:1,4-alpha-glucan branching enzyme